MLGHKGLFAYQNTMLTWTFQFFNGFVLTFHLLLQYSIVVLAVLLFFSFFDLMVQKKKKQQALDWNILLLSNQTCLSVPISDQTTEAFPARLHPVNHSWCSRANWMCYRSTQCTKVVTFFLTRFCPSNRRSRESPSSGERWHRSIGMPCRCKAHCHQCQMD